MESDACERCGFDPGDYQPRDLATAPRWLRSQTEGMVGAVAGDLGDARPIIDELRSVIDGLDADRPDADLVHRCIHLHRDASRRLHEIGLGVPSQAGTVVQLSISDGGVPKSAVPAVDVGLRGVLGDRQRDRKHHGRPFQALCLWSADVIEALRAEGHPIAPGSAGENVTVAGIDWPALRPGVRLLVGQVLCEVSGWADPCRHNDQWFSGTSSARIDHEVHPGWSRAYAWVLEPGSVSVGDAVVVEP